MTTIQKHINDLVCELSILVRSSDDKSFTVADCETKMDRVRVTKFYTFEITFFTDDVEKGITCSYEAGKYHNIDKGEHADFAIVNNDELATLNNGIIKYKVRFRMLSGKFENGYYDYSEINNTDLYLTDNTKKHDDWCEY